MTALFIPVLSSSLAVFAGDPQLIAAALFVSACYLALIGVRLSEFERMKALFQRRGLGSRGSLTGRIESLLWENELLSADSPQTTSRSQFEHSLMELLEKDGEGDFNEIGKFLLVQFRAAAMAFAAGEELRVKTRAGIPEERLKSSLQNALPALSEERSGSVGRPVGDAPFERPLLNLGIEKHILLPIRGRERAFLWLGYERNSPPLELEEYRAQTVARLWGAHLVQSHRLSEMAAAVEAKSQNHQQFLSHVSHDIRSPLNNIRAIIDLLYLEKEGDGDSREMLEAARSNCESLREIVESILDFSRYRSGNLTTRPEEFSLRELAEEVLSQFAVSFREKGLDTSLEASAEPVVFADRGQTRRILTNLISNAVKYTEHGSVLTRITSDGADRARIEVVDTGVGISPEQQSRLFHPFLRFEPNLSEGIGLGLTVTKILCEANSAELIVASKPGAGTSMTVELPTVSKPESVHARKGESSLWCKPNEGLSVLLVDDDNDCVESLGKALSGFGFEVLKAATERDAISLLNFAAPHVVVSDSEMPQGGADTILDYLSEQENPPPVIVLSGNPQASVSQDAYSHFQKPVDVSELSQEILLAAASLGSAVQAHVAPSLPHHKA